MCGIIGVFSVDSVNQQIYDNLLLLQHRGQDLVRTTGRGANITDDQHIPGALDLDVWSAFIASKTKSA